MREQRATSFQWFFCTTLHIYIIYFLHTIYPLTHVFEYTAQSRTLSLKLFRENSSYSIRFGASTYSRIMIPIHFSAITWLWFSIIWKLIIQFPWTLCIMVSEEKSNSSDIIIIKTLLFLANYFWFSSIYSGLLLKSSQLNSVLIMDDFPLGKSVYTGSALCPNAKYEYQIWGFLRSVIWQGLHTPCQTSLDVL